MKHMPLLILATIVTFLVAFACLMDGKPNWPVIQTEIDLAASDLSDLAELLSDPELVDDVTAASEALRVLGEALEGADPATRPDLLDASLSFVEELLDGIDLDRLTDEEKVLLVGVKSILRRARAYQPESA
jgi:hypothetical protein